MSEPAGTMWTVEEMERVYRTLRQHEKAAQWTTLKEWAKRGIVVGAGLLALGVAYAAGWRASHADCVSHHNRHGFEHCGWAWHNERRDIYK